MFQIPYKWNWRKKFKERGVSRKKNYVIYKVKLNTEKTQDITKISWPKPDFNPKSNQVREIEPKVEWKNNYEKKKEIIYWKLSIS